MAGGGGRRLSAGGGCADSGRPGVLAYARQRYPQQRLHLSVQGSATHADAIELMREQFGIQRVVLPRVLTVADIARLIEKPR